MDIEKLNKIIINFFLEFMKASIIGFELTQLGLLLVDFIQ